MELKFGKLGILLYGLDSDCIILGAQANLVGILDSWEVLVLLLVPPR